MILGLFCLFAVGAAPRVSAHAANTSYLDIQLPHPDGEVMLHWHVAVHDLIWSVFIDADFDGAVTAQELAAAQQRYLVPGVLSQVSLQRGGALCTVNVRDAALTTRQGESFISLTLRAHCLQPGLLGVGGNLYRLGEDSQVLLTATRAEETFTGVISTSSPRWNEPARASAWASFVRFIGAGVWHVWIGYDHIAFVLLLLLPSVLRPVDDQWRGADGLVSVAREVFFVVTAFTLAHSATLVLAVTGLVRLPSRPVELAIAASIVIAAAINLLPRLSRLRLPLAFGFGLVHGFGFASVLGELDTQGARLLPVLAGFNIGVEVAQLSIVAVVLPLIYLARSTRWYATGVLPLGSCALGAAGAVWLVQRI